MKITDYLTHQAQSLDHASQRIKDFRVFDFNYIPAEPLMREEAKPIIDGCLRYLKTGIANHLFIFGSRGCGKTLMVKYIGHLLSQQHAARVLYVNCQQHNTSFKILAHLVGVRPRGCSLDELWHRFCDTCSAPAIVVLDEVDLLSDKDRHKDILYLLSRSERSFMAILLSNHPKFLGVLDESIRSTLQPEPIHFRNYDANQIDRILRQRATAGLSPRLLKDRTLDRVIPLIAAMATRSTNADVRVALKTLYYAAMGSAGDVRSLFERARRDLVADLLADLNTHNLLILAAAAQTPGSMVKAVYERYRHLSRDEHEEPFSYVHFYSSLSYLQSLGLILLLSTKVGRTYANRIQTLFDVQALNAVTK